MDFPAPGPGTQLWTPVHPARLPPHPMPTARGWWGMSPGRTGCHRCNVKCKVIVASLNSSKFSKAFFPTSIFFSSVDFSIKTHYLKKSIHLELPAPRCLKPRCSIPVATLEQLGKTFLPDSVHEARYAAHQQAHDHL